MNTYIADLHGIEVLSSKTEQNFRNADAMSWTTGANDVYIIDSNEHGESSSFRRSRNVFCDDTESGEKYHDSTSDGGAFINEFSRFNAVSGDDRAGAAYEYHRACDCRRLLLSLDAVNIRDYAL